MNRFATFAESKDTGGAIEDLTSLQEMTFIYDYFKKTLKSIFTQKKYTLKKMLQLLSGFMNFSVYFYNGKYEYINEILKIAKSLCEEFKEETKEEESINYLVEILSTPLVKLSVLVINIEQFPALMEILPFDRKKEVALKITRAIVKSKTYLVNL